jgi:Fe-Mn family superoxide dismutase
MSSTKSTESLFEGLDIDGIIKKAVKSELPKILPESYVAEPKRYPQVSEFASTKTKEGHNELYQIYVDNTNRISAELDSVDRSAEATSASHSQFRSLKHDEATCLNAVWLHELYFANCFDPHSEVYMDSMAYMRLERDFGTFDDWQKDFIACAMTSGEGWAVLGYHTFLRRYVNMVVDGHSGNLMMGVYPIFVVDMWAHSYHRDYLNDKRSYLISRMREINWNVVEERITKSEAMAEALKK